MCASLPASSSSGYCKEQPAKGEIFHWLLFALPPLEEHEHKSHAVVTQGATPAISCEKKQHKRTQQDRTEHETNTSECQRTSHTKSRTQHHATNGLAI